MPETLYIIDGHAQIYRSYYAVMGLKSPSGEPTNATFGFVGMLLKLFQMRKPSHVVLAMDAGTSGRETLDTAYKAHRKPMPEDMPPQIDRILQICDTLGMPIYKAEGYEADDAIATLVRQVRADTNCPHCSIYMCTKDKDLDQLIDDQCVMYDIQTNEEINAAKLLEKKGYSPQQARDVLALTGDTVDNIPGIPGVGPKTAAKWIQTYGTLDNLIANADKITGKIGETFRANLHVLDNSRKLVELQFDVPVPPLDWKAASVHPELLPKLAPIFQQLGFTKLLSMLEQVVSLYRNEMPAAPVTRPASPPQPLAPAKSKIENQKLKIPHDSLSGGLFDTPTGESAEVTFATAAPEHAMQTDSDLEPAEAPVQPSGLRPVIGAYELINTPQKLDAMITTLREQLAALPEERAYLSVDTETDALGSMQSNLCGISLSASEATGYYIAIKGAGDCLDEMTIRERLGPLLADPSIKKVGQNLKYDINSLRNFGLQLNNIHFDTMVASYVIDSSRLSHGMDALAADILGLKPIPISDLIGKGAQQISFADVPLDRACYYAAEDADVTLRLANILAPQLKTIGEETEKLFRDLEMPLVQVLADMEYHGVMIDTKLLKTLSSEIEKKLFDLQGRIKTAAGVDFNQDSPKQLAEVLFKHLKLPVVKKTKTGPSTDITVLERLADKHPVPALVVEYRQLAKLKNTYLDTLADLPSKKTHRVHAHFNQTVAETGRLSSSDPNLQNIPVKTDIGREIRRAFIAEPGHVLISADYSQIELRVLAHYCQEKALIEAFAKNHDVHRLVAAELNNVAEDQVTPEMRAVAKTVNFGIIYGQTGFGLAQVLKIPQDQANQYVAAYRRRFPAIESFTHECIMQASTHGYVTTILGRRRAIPDINSPIQSRRQFGQRAALNSVIQGSAADLIKLAMVNLHKKIADRAQDIKMLMQIHDELVFECRAALAGEMSSLIRAEMEGAMRLKVPLKVDIGTGPNWLEND
ncbi:MAG TPA: DNA polymerase I [Phycisphaerae bacterium]|nr:DNA polymerase I [Phycisphaerae bacterium]